MPTIPAHMATKPPIRKEERKKRKLFEFVVKLHLIPETAFFSWWWNQEATPLLVALKKPQEKTEWEPQKVTQAELLLGRLAALSPRNLEMINTGFSQPSQICPWALERDAWHRSLFFCIANIDSGCQAVTWKADKVKCKTILLKSLFVFCCILTKTNWLPAGPQQPSSLAALLNLHWTKKVAGHVWWEVSSESVNTVLQPLDVHLSSSSVVFWKRVQFRQQF